MKDGNIAKKGYVNEEKGNNAVSIRKLPINR